MSGSSMDEDRIIEKIMRRIACRYTVYNMTKYYSPSSTVSGMILDRIDNDRVVFYELRALINRMLIMRDWCKENYE